jgi:hypothetical protein
MISDPEKKTLIYPHTSEDCRHEQYAFSRLDMLLVEGLKEIPLPKLILVDKERKILDLVSTESIRNVAAIVGPDDPASYSGLGIPVLHRDHIADIAAFIESPVRIFIQINSIERLGACRRSKCTDGKRQGTYCLPFQKPTLAYSGTIAAAMP